MTYLALARRYRPADFESILAQKRITRTLANAITTGRISHAYLFCGPRGTGKTSTARVLAKSLNCKNGPTATPCGECSNCLEIKQGNSPDVFEIDAASNRGIDDIRELRENVRYSPAASRYKIYIIDEVHRLTHEAFDAILKTLEEPPPHVIFIFATTEPQALPATILSRTQRFDFRRVPVSALAEAINN
ncbi:MAG: DNA polymerase III subunit gamma/tau, partial [candidate division Zixibacteria bacterium]|nr:DNA polymerase III subunit gamma/tau [candidate division Zixibacteria bacterium]